MPEINGEPTLSVAILAPRGRDAEVAAALLQGRGIDSVSAGSVADLLSLVDGGIGTVLVAEEALMGPDLARLHDWVGAQPAWSDLPFVVLTNGGTSARSKAERDRIDALGNALLLGRPLHADELVRAVQSALKARRRQYEARARMAELQLREAALAESERKFHAIANSVDQMIWSTLPDGFHDYYNDRWYEYTGVPKGSTDGEAWNEIFHPDDQERAWATWNHSLATGEPYHIEYRLRHHSGNYRWVLGRAQPVRDDAGTIIRWYGSCTDIHEQVIAREELSKSREYLEVAIRERTAELAEFYTKTPVALHTLDADGKLLSVSDRWLSLMSGARRQDVIGRPITDFVAPESLTEHSEDYGPRLLREGSIDDMPYVGLTMDGQKIDLLVSARLSRATAQKPLRIMASVVDVSKRKEAEAARDAAEAALRQSRKLETIGQLTGGVAHDFNNLLMAIRSSLELLERRLDLNDEKTRKFLENAVKATERGASLTQRMLAFARKQDLNAKAVDVTKLIPDMRDLLERTIGPEIRIETNIAPNVAQALVDANQLEMAILNLAVNARDAMEGAGKLTISLNCAPVDDLPELRPDIYVRIAVTDTGMGMDEATLAQAMEPFFTTKGVGKGTGLGLPMVYGLASQSGGTFRMTSSPGEGTTAEIYLPVAQDASADTAAEPARAKPADEPGSPKVILAVDDDVLVLMGTVGLLEDFGHDVLEASSGAQALDILAQRPDIQLVITDQAMPNMTGVELARTIKSKRPDLPVILASGYAEIPEGAEEFISARLEKPFSDQLLKSVIVRTIGSAPRLNR